MDWKAYEVEDEKFARTTVKFVVTFDNGKQFK